jgi:hypothetical protein
MALNQALYATSAEIGDWVRELAGKELRERRRSSGMDTPSSSGIPLETPTLGFERSTPAQVQQVGAAAALGSEVEARASSAPSALPADGSQAVPHAPAAHDAHEASAEAAATPPVGMRRAPLPRAEASDDEPTGRRSSLPEASRSVPAAQPLSRKEELARAVTLPMPVQAIPSGMRSVGARGADASGQDAGEDGDQTQPNRFVPARPGARRDGSTASPGAYSQIDGRRGRSAERGASRNFDEVATTTHPTQAARGERAEERAPSSRERSSAPPAGGSQRHRASPLPARRPITEMAPTYVQRRDSNPTRMQIPDGPVGVPHRSFPQDDINSDVHRVDVRGVAQPQGKVDLRGREPGNPDEAREQSHPRVRHSELAGLHVGMVDSLSPSTTAAQTAPPQPPAPAGRSWPLWLASGVLAAIILLAVGVGVRQWMAGPMRPLPSTRHVAREREPEPAFEAPVREPPAAQPAPESAFEAPVREPPVAQPAPESAFEAPVREPPVAQPAQLPAAASAPGRADVAAATPPPAPASALRSRARGRASTPDASAAGVAPARDRRQRRAALRPVPATRRPAPLEKPGAASATQPRPAVPAAPAHAPAAGLPDNPY